LLLPVDAGVDLLELVKDPGLVRRGDADSGVGDRDLDGIDEPHGGDAHHAARWRELDGVGNEVQQHLLELACVRLDVAGSSDSGLEADLFLRHQRLRDVAHLLGDLRDRHLLKAKLHLAGLDLGEVEDVVDQPEQMLSARMDLLQEAQLRLLLVLPIGRVDQQL